MLAFVPSSCLPPASNAERWVRVGVSSLRSARQSDNRRARAIWPALRQTARARSVSLSRSHAALPRLSPCTIVLQLYLQLGRALSLAQRPHCWAAARRRPSLAESCSASPKAMECHAWAAAKKAAATAATAAAPRRALLSAGVVVSGAAAAGVQLKHELTPAAAVADVPRGPDGGGGGGVHPSGALLVADSPEAFAQAAMHAMSDSAAWERLSSLGLRHLRTLGQARMRVT